jgi:hypothetical protein
VGESPSSKPTAGERRPYEPPSLLRVALRPDEAVLGFCKLDNKAGPLHGNCRAVGQCATQGS